MLDVDNKPDYIRYLLDVEDLPSNEYLNLLLDNDLYWNARVSCLSWILQIGNTHEVGNETKYLAMILYDRYLQGVSELIVEERGFYLPGLSCFLLATKMQEFRQLNITEGPEGSLFLEAEIMENEKVVIDVLDYNFDPVTPFKFLEYFMQNMSKPIRLDRAIHIVMVSLRHIGVLRFRPSLVVAAAALISSSDGELGWSEIDTRLQKVIRVLWIDTDPVVKCYKLLSGLRSSGGGNL